MNITTWAAATAITLASATSSFAATLDFNFSFVDDGGLVEGTIFGLEDNAITLGSAAAPVIAIVTLSERFESDYRLTNEIPGVAQVTTFSRSLLTSIAVTNGVITSANFSGTSSPDLDLDFRNGINGQILGVFFDDDQGGESSGPVTFTQVAAVPLPASGLLLVAGFGGIAVLKRRKKHAA